MKIRKALIQAALQDAHAKATINGFQLGDEEFVVVIVGFAEPESALRFMASMALWLREIDTSIGALASVAAVETAPSTGGNTIIRFRGWQLEG